MIFWQNLLNPVKISSNGVVSVGAFFQLWLSLIPSKLICVADRLKSQFWENSLYFLDSFKSLITNWYIWKELFSVGSGHKFHRAIFYLNHLAKQLISSSKCWAFWINKTFLLIFFYQGCVVCKSFVWFSQSRRNNEWIINNHQQYNNHLLCVLCTQEGAVHLLRNMIFGRGELHCIKTGGGQSNL